MGGLSLRHYEKYSSAWRTATVMRQRDTDSQYKIKIELLCSCALKCRFKRQIQDSIILTIIYFVSSMLSFHGCEPLLFHFLHELFTQSSFPSIVVLKRRADAVFTLGPISLTSLISVDFGS